MKRRSFLARIFASIAAGLALRFHSFASIVADEHPIKPLSETVPLTELEQRWQEIADCRCSPVEVFERLRNAELSQNVQAKSDVQSDCERHLKLLGGLASDYGPKGKLKLVKVEWDGKYPDVPTINGWAGFESVDGRRIECNVEEMEDTHNDNPQHFEETHWMSL